MEDGSIHCREGGPLDEFIDVRSAKLDEISIFDKFDFFVEGTFIRNRISRETLR